MRSRDAGFTLLELLVVVSIIMILAAIAIPQYSQYRYGAYNIAAKADLRNAMTAIEAAIASGAPLPATPSDLARYGHRLSPGVSFTRFTVRTIDGQQSVHMHTKHAKSPNSWHADYPATGSTIEVR